mmetsp:Transcript_12704/g.24652  ORF Transcript_12704/g.24652 Transcript_12704/m.24652 type:complete len:81 (+) Transcript_12704:182-424(+)|eukprot:CAMPEP_0171502956 /NCGR_PEP_ID=MMETSP0958-20121227/10535_1 /TAXON_ID=87120 /ORGANISM="Aurantiochytrium limacinum, Strain ATCCMYA-1381" /LENGTH=80 /DNA_ID=CAMNT_0012038207 /DNA_START=293 /DNA_END=535 /DNA_ORIENTATION=+
MSDGVNTKYMALLAAAPQIGDSCLQANKKFVQCKQGDQNPASCVSEGEKVVSCTLSVYVMVMKDLDAVYLFTSRNDAAIH